MTVTGFSSVHCATDDRKLQPLSIVLYAAGDGAGADAGSGDALLGGGGSTGAVGGSSAGGAPFAAGGSTGGDAPATGGSGENGDGAGSGGDTSGTGGCQVVAGDDAVSACTGGTTGSGGSGGSAGMAITGGPCPDLDGDGVLDCEQSLADNPSFDTDVSGWLSEPNVLLSWSSDDALGHDFSGSLNLLSSLEVDQDGSVMVGAYQCIAVTSSVEYRFIVQASIVEADMDSSAAFQLLPYDGPDCTGNVIETVTAATVQGSDWNVIDKKYLTPGMTKSISMRLVSIKPFRKPMLSVRFDNVLVRQE
ncbi:MAG TPA: hypothetical protein VMI54_28190 [Polyangiaceae bacterium]|nr:hypothetical protein [Polyangiaceae bacterium]